MRGLSVNKNIAVTEEQLKKLEQLVSRLLEANETSHFAGLEVLDLSEVLDSYEHLTPQLLKKIAEQTLDLLRGSIPEPGFCFRMSDKAYAVVLIGLDQTAASRFMQDTTRVLLERLRADERLQNIEVGVELEELTEGSLTRATRDRRGDTGGAGVGEGLSAVDRSGDPTELIYRPVWDARNGILNANVCYVRKSTANGYEYGYSTLENRESLSAIADLDCALLRQNIQFISEWNERSKPILLISPVRFEAIRSRANNARYYQILQSIPPRIRRHLSLCVVGAAAASQMDTVRWTLASLSNLCRSVIVYAPLDCADFSGFAGLKLSAIATSIYADARPKAMIEADLNLFVARSRRAKADALLFGVESVQGAQAALAAGVRYMGGPFIGGDTVRPGFPRYKSFTGLLLQEGAGFEGHGDAESPGGGDSSGSTPPRGKDPMVL